MPVNYNGKWDYSLLFDLKIFEHCGPVTASLYANLECDPMFVMLDLNVSLNIILYLFTLVCFERRHTNTPLWTKRSLLSLERTCQDNL